MRKKPIWLIVSAVAIALVLFALVQRQGQPTKSSLATTSPSPKASTEAAKSGPLSSTGMHIPAHYESAPPASKLAAIVAPEQFSGKAREAYQAVRATPQLIAQMPCYCHCDRGLGHKSLHSCFEDDHAATCATCIDEALMAYQLQKRGMSPTQIREQIIAQFGD
jgi:hypothetical protein